MKTMKNAFWPIRCGKEHGQKGEISARRVGLFSCCSGLSDPSTFLPRDALVHSAVLRLHVVRPSVCPSVCDVDGSGSHKLEILENNCTDN